MAVKAKISFHRFGYGCCNGPVRCGVALVQEGKVFKAAEFSNFTSFSSIWLLQQTQTRASFAYVNRTVRGVMYA